MPGTVAIKMSEQDHDLIHQLIKQLEKVTSDHELRIRWLERVLSYGIGGATVIYWIIQQLTVGNGGS